MNSMKTYLDIDSLVYRVPCNLFILFYFRENHISHGQGTRNKTEKSEKEKKEIKNKIEMLDKSFKKIGGIFSGRKLLICINVKNKKIFWKSE